MHMAVPPVFTSLKSYKPRDWLGPMGCEQTFSGRRLTSTANEQLPMLSPLCHWGQGCLWPSCFPERRLSSTEWPPVPLGIHCPSWPAHSECVIQIKNTPLLLSAMEILTSFFLLKMQKYKIVRKEAAGFLSQVTTLIAWHFHEIIKFFQEFVSFFWCLCYYSGMLSMQRTCLLSNQILLTLEILW